MTKFILRWAINAVALYAAVMLLSIELQGGWVSIIWLALIFGLVNALLRPLLKLLTCPLIILTLGLFTLVINTALFYLSGWIGQTFGVGFAQMPDFWTAFLGSLVVSLVSFVLSMILKDELRERHSPPRRRR